MAKARAGFRMIGSANRGFARHALQEIRRLFPGVEATYLEPDEVFLFGFDGQRGEAIRALRAREPVFLRHVQPVERDIELGRARADLSRIADLAKDETRLCQGEKVAIQVRKRSRVPFDYTPYAVKEALDPVLVRRFGVEPTVRAADRIISIYLTAHSLYWGLSPPRENLSDWSGGMARFRRERGQVSRAEFKLLEAEERFGLRLERFRRALDVGAAPGGWTSLLLRRGLRVTAVDPSPLHPLLPRGPRLTYLGVKAEEVSFEPASFDLLACDMNWDPYRMAKLVTGLLPALESGGRAIVTVKLMGGKPFRTITAVSAELGKSAEVLCAKQLFHNRKEVTLYLRKRG